MKKIFSIITLFFLIQSLFCENKITAERIYIFKVMAFNQEIEFYCAKKQIGYYKYPQAVQNTIVYLTYEGNIYFIQCKFDENFVIFNSLYPANIWANSKGEVLNFKKKYEPVINKNKKSKNYPYGFGKN